MSGNNFYTVQIEGLNPNYINHFFRRAPWFFDVVAYTGNGVVRTINHNLGVAPELIIIKGRAGTNGMGDWNTYHSSLGNTAYIDINFADAKTVGSTIWNSTTPTPTVFSLSNSNGVNNSSTTYIAYLFATLPNISKVWSYTWSASNVAVSCGFTSAPRFLLVKRTDQVGDWYVWDSARGFDKRLSLNTTAAEVTGDTSVTTSTSGFNATAGGVANANGGSYIYLCVH